MKRVISLLSIVLGLFSCVEVKSNLNFTTADSIINAAIADSVIPGAVLCVVDDTQIVYLNAYGYRRVCPYQDTMTVNTIFDLASLTKPIGAGSAALMLSNSGLLDVDKPVETYIPGYHKDVTVRHLLTHYSGLPAYMGAARLDSICFAQGIQDKAAYLIDTIARCARANVAGEKYRYSCLNFISLQKVVESIVGIDINTYLRSALYADLGLTNMGWLPSKSLLEDVAPTECLQDDCLHGQVHDPLARVMMSGLSGNAGIFATASDVAKWAIWFMQQPADVRQQGCQAGLWTDTVVGSQGELQRCRHTGYTGTSVTIIPQSGRAVVLLTNRVHPKDEHSLGDLRTQLNEWLVP